MIQRKYLALFLFSSTAFGPGGAGAAPDPSGNVEHVVLCWLKHPTEANRDKVIETSRELAAIPGVRDLRAGPALESDRDSVDDSFDVGITMSFRSRADMEKYIHHEEHVRRIHEVFRPLCGEIRVHDFSF